MIVDSILVIFCIICFIRGVLRGTVKEVFAIAGIFTGLFFASIFYGTIAHLLFGWVANIRTGNLFSFLLIFCTIYFLMSIIGIISTYIFRIAKGGLSNRVTGGIIGSFKAILLVSVLIIPLVSFSPEPVDIVKGSRIFPIESRISEHMINRLSDNLGKKFHIKLNKIVYPDFMKRDLSRSHAKTKFLSLQQAAGHFEILPKSGGFRYRAYKKMDLNHQFEFIPRCKQRGIQI